MPNKKAPHGAFLLHRYKQSLDAMIAFQTKPEALLRFENARVFATFHTGIPTPVSMGEANQNFSKVARLVDERGSAVILKNNVPRYLVIEFNQAEKMQDADDEDVMAISAKLMKKNREAYEVLAK